MRRLRRSTVVLVAVFVVTLVVYVLVRPPAGPAAVGPGRETQVTMRT